MKKVIVILSIVIAILSIILGIVSVNLYKITHTNNEKTYYGQRGNISTSEKIQFLSKNDDLLVGMMNLKYSEEEVAYTTDDMTTFAVYVAKYRYGETLEKVSVSGGKTSYKIDTEIIDGIIKEFFGTQNIIHSEVDNDYYSRSRGYFLIDQEFEQSMWFYPVSEEKTEVTEKIETEDSEENTEIKKNYIIITADSIYIDETKEESEYKNIKYDGMYDDTIVEYTIKFKYDENGKLISYQYINKK